MMTSSTTTTTKNPASLDSPTVRPIPTTVDGHEIDALICKEMNQMSLQERERTFDEIHGVHPIVHETPDLIPMAVHQFQTAISRIAHKPAYLVARQQSEAYVTSPQFALLFLRAASFDALEAAQKCVDYCQGKLDLFGIQTLTRSVQLSDLNSDDLACLKSGAYQWLSTRDASGRCVMLDFHLTMPQCYKEPINLLRTVAFLHLAAAEDEENQKRGRIGISYYMGKFNHTLNHPLNQQMAQMSSWMPMKLHALHICLNHESELQAWKPLAMLLLGSPIRLRVRLHEGKNQTQVNESLLTFGIPIDAIPISLDGIVKTTIHTKWIHRRKCLEEHRQAILLQHRHLGGIGHGDSRCLDPRMLDGNLIIDMPAKWDVILRRGRIYHDHPGNIRMKQIMEAHLVAYGAAQSTRGKNDIVRSIMEMVQQQNGEGGISSCTARFVEMAAQGWWVPVRENDVLKRLGKSIRSLHAKTKVQQHLQQVPTVEAVGPCVTPSLPLPDEQEEHTSELYAVTSEPTDQLGQDLHQDHHDAHRDKKARVLNH